MQQSVFSSPAQREMFVTDVLDALSARYMLPDGTIIEGASLSYLQADLRSHYNKSGRRWRLGGGYWGFTSALDEAGFKRVRARTMRYTRNGEFKPYQECDVVTI